MDHDLDLLLVNPGSHKQVYGELANSLKGIEPPLWCALIAAYVRQKGYSVKIIDSEAENLDPDNTAEKIVKYNPLLAGLVIMGSNPSASSTPKMTAASETLDALKKINPSLKTIIGGLHPSALPEKTLNEENVNYLYQGEGYDTVSDLLKKLEENKKCDSLKIPGLWYKKNGKIISNKIPSLINNLDSLPFAAWDLLPMEKYRAHNWHCFDHINNRGSYAVIYTSLGCPFNCAYCNIHSLYDGKPGIRFRSPENVVEEIDYLVKNFNIKNLKFVDELFAIKEDRVIDICNRITKGGYDLNIWAYARVDTITKNMTIKMKQAGINWLAYGFESANKNVRKGVDKKFDEDTVSNAVKMTQSAGINIIANFIFGLPDDDLDTMQETLDMAKEYNFEYANFYSAMAYPGSKLYEESLDKGIKLPRSWHGYSQYSDDTLPLPTKHLSSVEVLEFRDKAFQEYFNNPNYLKMIKEKFGSDVEDHIKNMLSFKIKRNMDEVKK